MIVLIFALTFDPNDFIELESSSDRIKKVVVRKIFNCVDIDKSGLIVGAEMHSIMETFVSHWATKRAPSTPSEVEVTLTAD